MYKERQLWRPECLWPTAEKLMIASLGSKEKWKSCRGGTEAQAADVAGMVARRGSRVGGLRWTGQGKQARGQARGPSVNTGREAAPPSMMPL